MVNLSFQPGPAFDFITGSFRYISSLADRMPSGNKNAGLHGEIN
jgi:hypothetical protein